jgi:hypothetical protein
MPNLSGIDVALGFRAMISTNGLSLSSLIMICVNLWMSSFDVWKLGIGFFFTIFCCTLQPFVRGLLSQLHFEASVKMRLTLPKVGTWSLSGLQKFQSSSARVKTPHLEVFFIPLERSWSVDVKNGLAWAIRTFAAQVMVERRARNQTCTLIPDH